MRECRVTGRRRCRQRRGPHGLARAVARCGVCGRAMVARPVTYKLKRGGTSTIHYYRCSKAYGYSGRCEHTRVYRAEQLEGRVWDLVLSLLRAPERLRTALDRLIEEERKAHRGDPEREARTWLKKIAEADRTRSRFQDMAAEGLISFDELRGKLAGLQETREAARRELDALSERRARLAELEGDRAELLAAYTGKAPPASTSSPPRSATRPTRSSASSSSCARTPTTQAGTSR